MSRTELKMVRWAVLLMSGASLAACASVEPPSARYPVRGADLGRTAPPTAKGPTTYKTGEPYQVGGIWYVPHEQPDYDETGVASWYGDAFNMKATANGEIFDMNAFSAAHTTLPLPSLVEVTNLDNGRRMVVRVNDRGPFIGGRIIDLSHAAAAELGYADKGLAKVRVRYVGPAPLAGPEAGVRMANASPSKAPVRAEARVQLADAAPMEPPAWGFHKPLATRLPAGAVAAPIQATAAVAPKAVAGGAAVAHATAATEDDDVILTSYKAPQPVGVTTLASLPTAKPAEAAPLAPPAPRAASVPKAAKPHAPLTGAELGPPHGERIALPVFPADAAQAQSFRIQAGAFSSADNAHRAAAQLASAGPASVEPYEKDGVTLYRVFVPGADDEVAAYAIRDRVAAAGYADARVVKGGGS